MFGNLLLNFGAWAVGLKQSQLTFIEKRLPNMRKLIAAVVKAQPLIQKLAPMFDEAEPVFLELIPLVKEASIELQAVGPALELILSVIEREAAQGNHPNDVIATIQRAIANMESGVAKL